MPKRLLHITLALLTFLSTTGLVLNQHYCQSELRSQALFVKAENCHSAKKNMPKACPMHAPDSDQEKDCCDDETHLLQLDEDLQQTTFEYKKLQQPQLLLTALILLGRELPTFEISSPHYLNYRPPLLVCDRPVLLQTFLC